MAGEDLLASVELLRQERADQQMRPGELPEGEQAVGSGADAVVEPVGPADHEGDVLDALVAPSAEPPAAA